MAVAAILNKHVQIAQRVRGEGLKKVLDQFRIEVANLGTVKRSVEDEKIAARKIDGGGAERLFHRQREMAVAANARLVAEGLPDCLPQADADVFHRMMLIDVQISLGF